MRDSSLMGHNVFCRSTDKNDVGINYLFQHRVDWARKRLNITRPVGAAKYLRIYSAMVKWKYWTLKKKPYPYENIKIANLVEWQSFQKCIIFLLFTRRGAFYLPNLEPLVRWNLEKCKEQKSWIFLLKKFMDFFAAICKRYACCTCSIVVFVFSYTVCVPRLE